MPYAYFSSLLQSFQNNMPPSAANSRQRIATNVSPTSYQPRKVQEIVFTILYIFAAFYICFLVPIAIAMALALVHPINKVISLFLAVATILVYLYPLLNPFFYLWRMNDIRNEVRQLVKNMFREGN